MTIRTDYGFRFISIHEILYITKQESGIRLHLNNQRTEDINDIHMTGAESFGTYPFCKVSDSCAVNRWHVCAWDKRTGTVRMLNGDQLVADPSYPLALQDKTIPAYVHLKAS